MLSPFLESRWDRRAILTAMAALATVPTVPVDARARATADPFALGVASGDPAADGFVLWTRLVGPGVAPLEAAAIRVTCEIAADAGFRHIIRRMPIVAHPESAHSVHVEVGGLSPGRPYWYRFHALGATSPIGRAITVPARADRLRLAVTSCQHWEQARFGAYRDIMANQPDLIVQLGDYIYEQSYPGAKVREFGAAEPRDLAGYRQRHALYKTDVELQAAHRAAPWIVTWDDHEVLNDYAGLANREGVPGAIFAPRRAAAYQAYFEHMPIRPSLWKGRSSPRLYRPVDWADLVSLSVLDTRQYRSAPPCAPPDTARNVRLETCTEAAAPNRSIMGSEQEAWLSRRFAGEKRRWSLVAQQVFFAPLWLDAGHTATFSDQWDGYAANRTRVIAEMSRPNVRNAVVLSGDVHSFWANDLQDGTGRTCAGEIVTSALAAAPPPAGRFGDVTANNPHVRYSDVERSGYVLIDVDRRRLTAEMRTIGDRADVTSPSSALASFTMADGQPGWQRS